MKDGLKFVSTVCGVQFVMADTEDIGITVMVWLFVDNLDIKN